MRKPFISYGLHTDRTGKYGKGGTARQFVKIKLYKENPNLPQLEGGFQTLTELEYRLNPNGKIILSLDNQIIKVF